MFQLSGTSIIGFQRGTSAATSFHGINPATREELPPKYYAASAVDVDRAATLSNAAFEIYRNANGKVKGALLRKIAENIESLGDALVNRASEETGLPTARISSERARTCFQLRLFAELVEEGSWVDARIDRGDSTRTPLPKPDVRSVLRPVGPVAVFCASNFPLAFSVAGGDTASALAAGNPVIVKAHHAHPGTAELVGLAVVDAVRSCDLHEGLFSLIFGPGNVIGTQILNHPFVKAGGFTGSRSGGQALLKLANARPEPIPFFAEMSSVNPIFVLPGALRQREEQLATGLQASVTLGAGQFCTNPGLIFVPAESTSLVRIFAEKMNAASSFTMLTKQIGDSYRNGTSSFAKHPHVKSLSVASEEADKTCAAVFQTDANTFRHHPELQAEIFGPATLLICYSDPKELLPIVRDLEGQLTATIHATEAELSGLGELLSVLETKAGRIIFNGFPTGVEVCHSMVHGGPYPATSDGRSTSVGTRAALRFVRPVCYQDVPDATLPEELQNANPLKIWRLLDGQFTKEGIQ